MIATVPWEVWTIVVPFAAATLAFVLGPRCAPFLGMTAAGGVVFAVAGLNWRTLQYGPAPYPVGGWGAPLRIELQSDGLSVFMLLMTAVVGCATSLYATGYFAAASDANPSQVDEAAQSRTFFWPLWLFMWAALNALFLSADIFNLYVTLELSGLASVGLVALGRTSPALMAAMRYILVALLGSLSYLLGVALLYAAHGTLDMTALQQVITPGPAVWLAMTLMTVGLLMKSALFPLHFWLPPAHANAPGPVSALLSALVVKASFYLLLRFWFGVFPTVLVPIVGQVLGILGALAILWGSLQALRQPRLKLLVAYSTVAQIGYLFLMFFLVIGTSQGALAVQGGVYFALSHACAKAAAFLAAGTIMHALDHDRIDQMDGIGQHLPITLFALGLAGVSLMGLPPSGGFVAKWMLLNAALASHHWWVAVVISLGSVLAGGYVFRILRRALAVSEVPYTVHRVPRRLEWGALSLALVAVVLGCMATPPLALLEIGDPFGQGVVVEGSP